MNWPRRPPQANHQIRTSGKGEGKGASGSFANKTTAVGGRWSSSCLTDRKGVRLSRRVSQSGLVDGITTWAINRNFSGLHAVLHKSCVAVDVDKHIIMKTDGLAWRSGSCFLAGQQAQDT
jgi:hypothetical protein